MKDERTTTVGIREFKTRLGSYLRLVRRGTRLIVTDRGRPVAQMCPLTVEQKDPEALLQEMVVLGEATRTSQQELEPFTPVDIKNEPLSKTILDERDDRP